MSFPLSFAKSASNSFPPTGFSGWHNTNSYVFEVVLSFIFIQHDFNIFCFTSITVKAVFDYSCLGIAACNSGDFNLFIISCLTSRAFFIAVLFIVFKKSFMLSTLCCVIFSYVFAASKFLFLFSNGKSDIILYWPSYQNKVGSLYYAYYITSPLVSINACPKAVLNISLVVYFPPSMFQAIFYLIFGNSVFVILNFSQNDCVNPPSASIILFCKILIYLLLLIFCIFILYFFILTILLFNLLCYLRRNFCNFFIICFLKWNQMLVIAQAKRLNILLILSRKDMEIKYL